MTHFKKTALTLSVLTISSLSLAQPAFAANPLEMFRDSFRDRLTKIYLQLPGNKSGEAVLKETAAAMLQLKSANSTVDTNFSVVGANDQEVAKGSFTVAGPSEIADINNPMTAKQDAKLSGEVAMQGTSFKAEADMKVNGPVVYLNIRQMPMLPFMNLSTLQNQWLKMDLTAQQQSPEALTSEKQQRLRDAFTKLILDSKVSQAKKENLDGHKVFAMDVSVSDDSLREYVKTTWATAEMNEEAIAQQEKELNKVLEALNDVNVKLWVDRSSYHVRKFEVPLVFDTQKMQASAQATESVENAQASDTARAQAMTPFQGSQDVRRVTVTLVGTMTDFNKPVTIEFPAEAKNFQDAWAEAMGVLGQGGTTGSSSLFPTTPLTAEPSFTEAKIPPTEFAKLSPEEKKMLIDAGIGVGN